MDAHAHAYWIAVAPFSIRRSHTTSSVLGQFAFAVPNHTNWIICRATPSRPIISIRFSVILIFRHVCSSREYTYGRPTMTHCSIAHDYTPNSWRGNKCKTQLTQKTDNHKTWNWRRSVCCVLWSEKANAKYRRTSNILTTCICLSDYIQFFGNYTFRLRERTSLTFCHHPASIKSVVRHLHLVGSFRWCHTDDAAARPSPATTHLTSDSFRWCDNIYCLAFDLGSHHEKIHVNYFIKCFAYSNPHSFMRRSLHAIIYYYILFVDFFTALKQQSHQCATGEHQAVKAIAKLRNSAQQTARSVV